VFKAKRGQLVEGSHRGRASAPSVPIERDRALPSTPASSAFKDVSLDHEPTPIERGTDVHLNHPLQLNEGSMIRDPLDGSRGHLTLPPCERAAKGSINKPESSPRSP
jgi:hypothetical protein